MADKVDSTVTAEERDDAALQHQDSEDERNLQEIDQLIPADGSADAGEYEEEDSEVIKQQEELEDEMEKELAQLSTEDNNSSPSKPAAKSGEKASGAYVPAGALPVQNGKLSKFAKDFWFPEARNCSCCKGFKHGCSCCQGQVQSCTNPTCIDSAFTSQVNQDLANRPPVPAPAPAPAAASTPITFAGRAPQQMQLHLGQRGKSAPSTMGPTYCKFEMSPSGCRFGTSCRFVHQNPAVVSNMNMHHHPQQGMAQGGMGNMMAPMQSGGGGGMMHPGAMMGQAPMMMQPPPQGGGMGGYPMAGGYMMAGPTSPTASGNPNATKCIYFAQGYCQFGDSCRFSHS